MCARCHTEGMENDYQFADTLATRMLAEGLARANEEHGLSIRQLGKNLGYKQAVVLSHMANGRVPIPIDRIEILADTLGLNKTSFLQAVLKQRHPTIPWHLLSGEGPAGDHDTLANELEAILGTRLKNLTKEQRAVMREVANEPTPRRRWLAEHEIYPVKQLRDLFPRMREDGLTPADLELTHALIEDESPR